MPKVSIIIPSYNCAQFIAEALDSVLEQTYKDFEAIIIDDGSTDNLKDVVAPYLTRFPDKVRYIYQENQGLANARNTAIKHARGEFLALLDADDKWLPNRLEEGIKVMEANPDVGLLHSNITRFAEDGRILPAPVRRKKFLSGSIFKHIFLRQADVACPTALFRKECCDKVGVFDPNLARLGCEDRDLWLRIAREYRVLYLDQVLAMYRVRKSSMSRNYEKMFKAQMYVIEKYSQPQDQGYPLRHLAVARIHRNRGDELLQDFDFQGASEAYLKALQHHPLSFWSCLNLFKAVLRIKIKPS